MPGNIGDVIRVTAKFSFDDEAVQNVYHIRLTATSTETDAAMLSDIADWLDDAYTYVYQAMTTAVTFDSINAYNLTAERFMGETTWPVLTAGTLTDTTSLPPQVAALVRFPTETLRSQGRKFLPPMGEAVSDGTDGWTTGTLTALASFASSILLGVLGVDYSAYPGNWNEDLSRWAAWASSLVNAYAATQRRRRKGVGA
jgi:hypothetical protein